MRTLAMITSFQRTHTNYQANAETGSGPSFSMRTLIIDKTAAEEFCSSSIFQWYSAVSLVYVNWKHTPLGRKELGIQACPWNFSVFPHYVSEVKSELPSKVQEWDVNASFSLQGLQSTLALSPLFEMPNSTHRQECYKQSHWKGEMYNLFLVGLWAPKTLSQV